MSGTVSIAVGGAERAVQPAPAGKGRRVRLRHLWLVPGVAVAIFANQLGGANGVGILVLIAFGIAPDVPRLFGIGRRGGLSRSGSYALRTYNLLHHPGAPVAAVAVAATGIVPVVWLVGALVWLGHVVIGWAVGDVPRHEDPSNG